MKNIDGWERSEGKRPWGEEKTNRKKPSGARRNFVKKQTRTARVGGRRGGLLEWGGILD